MKLQKAALAAAIALIAAPAAAQQVTFMTGPQGGSWIPLGGALKGMWEKAVPGLNITQTPGAGIDGGSDTGTSARASRSGCTNGAHARDRSSAAVAPRASAATASAIAGHWRAVTGRSSPRSPLRTCRNRGAISGHVESP